MKIHYLPLHLIFKYLTIGCKILQVTNENFHTAKRSAFFSAQCLCLFIFYAVLIISMVTIKIFKKLLKCRKALHTFTRKFFFANYANLAGKRNCLIQTPSHPSIAQLIDVENNVSVYFLVININQLFLEHINLKLKQISYDYYFRSTLVVDCTVDSEI